jgi:hypothetical protein
MKMAAPCQVETALPDVRPNKSSNPESEAMLVASRLLTNNVLFANSMRKLSQS